MSSAQCALGFHHSQARVLTVRIWSPIFHHLKGRGKGEQGEQTILKGGSKGYGKGSKGYDEGKGKGNGYNEGQGKGKT